MTQNPYESPQASLDDKPSWTRAKIIATIRASIAEIGLGLSLLLLLILQIATIVPGSEKGFYQLVAQLGCAGLLHPYRLPFILGVISLAVLVVLVL